jgi:integrase
VARRLIFPPQDSVEPEKITLGKFLERWLRDAAKPTLKATTYANYERAVERSIKPYLGGVKLAKLTALQIHGMYATLAKEGATADKIGVTHAVLHRALKQAVRWRLLPINVCADVERPKVERTEVTPLGLPDVVATGKFDTLLRLPHHRSASSAT